VRCACVPWPPRCGFGPAHCAAHPQSTGSHTRGRGRKIPPTGMRTKRGACKHAWYRWRARRSLHWRTCAEAAQRRTEQPTNGEVARPQAKNSKQHKGRAASARPQAGRHGEGEGTAYGIATMLGYVVLQCGVSLWPFDVALGCVDLRRCTGPPRRCCFSVRLPSVCHRGITCNTTPAHAVPSTAHLDTTNAVGFGGRRCCAIQSAFHCGACATQCLTQTVGRWDTSPG
jgi:hypothetical protein